MAVSLFVERTGEVLADEVVEATSIRSRIRGLLGTSRLGDNRVLLLEPAKQVHTFGMRYAIDVVFCDRDLVVLRIVRSMKPGRVTRLVPGSYCVLEMEAGTASNLVPGDRLVSRI